MKVTSFMQLFSWSIMIYTNQPTIDIIHKTKLIKESLPMPACKRSIYRIATVLIIALLGLSALYAKNDMNIIPLSSPIYGYIDDLYTLEGHAAAQGARPWTNADLRQQLERVTPTSEAARKLYDEIEAFLAKDDNSKVTVDWNIAIEPAMAIHSNSANFDESGKWAVPVQNNKLIRGEVGLYAMNYFAGKFGLSIGLRDSANARGYVSEDGTYYFQDSENEERFNSIFSTNIPFISKGSIDTDVTDNSFISLGTPYISISLGRGQVSWGNGAMGNLILGNTLPYHDYISISASNNTWFDYTMLMSFFMHPQNYYQGFTEEIHGIQLFLGHRFEFRMLYDTLRLTLSEAIMYHSPDNTLDFRIFNPLLILHGLFIPANANSLASIEVEYSPIKRLQLYLSFALDDLAVGDEPKAPENDATLNMWGISGGVRSAIPLNEGYFSILGEVVYTSPFMYHKDSYQNGDGSEKYNYALDYVGSVRLSNGRYRRQYLSYPFGSDALAVLGGFSYTVPHEWSAGLKLFFMAHGVTDENSIAKKYDGTENYIPGWLATMNPFDPSENGDISYTYNVGFDGEYYVLDNLSFSSSIDFIYAVNFENMKGNQFDIQWTLGMKYSIF